MSGRQEEDQPGGSGEDEGDQPGGQQVSVEEEEELREQQWWMHVCVYVCL